MKRVVSAAVAAVFAAVSLAAVAQTSEKQKADAAAQKPATAEKAKQGAAPSTKAEPKADAKPGAQPATAK